MALKAGELYFNGVYAKDFTDIWVKDFDPGVDPVSSTDIENPVFDDTFPGSDFYRGPTWLFELVCEGKTQAQTLDTVDRLKRAWRPTGAKRGGVLYPLRFNLAGRDRVAWGRPRKFSHTPQDTSLQGFVIVEVEFQLLDPLLYAGEPFYRQLSIVPPLARGLKEPLVEPLSTGGPSGVRQGMIEDTGGTAPTPFIVRVYGPIKDPFFSINGRKYGFNLSLSEGQELVVDSRLGTAKVGSRNALSVMRDRTRLRSVRLPAGKAVEIQFGGSDPTGLSRARFEWSPAFYGL